MRSLTAERVEQKEEGKEGKRKRESEKKRRKREKEEDTSYGFAFAQNGLQPAVGVARQRRRYF
jgi:hypothetical protein